MKSKAVALFALVASLAFAQALFAQEAQKKGAKKRPGGPIGKVKSIDTTANSITLAIRERGKKKPDAEKKAATDKTFKLAKDCKVTIGTESKTLADVKPDMFVSLTVGENDEVTAIKSFEPQKKKKKENT